MPNSTHVLLCCEAGGGRGHETALAIVARALGPQHSCQAILPRLTHATILEPYCVRVDRGPHLSRLNPLPKVGGINWANWLLMRGFADQETLKTRFNWWRDSLCVIRPGIVVADFAPTALMAARSLGIPTIKTGPAFGLPPSSLPQFPELLTTEQAAAHGTVVVDAPKTDEAKVCDVINQALGPLGLPSLSRLPEVYTADLALPRGLEVWDPYAQWRDRPLLLPVETLPPLQDGTGSEIFIYLPPTALKDREIVEALRRLPFTARLVTSGPIDDSVQALCDNPHLQIEPVPLSHQQIVARSRVILCAGQAGTLCLALLAGIPVLALPTQHEHISNAVRAAAKLESCRVIPKAQRKADVILDTIAEMWSQTELTQTARAIATELRSQYKESALDSYRRILKPMLDAAARAPDWDVQPSFNMTW